MLLRPSVEFRSQPAGGTEARLAARATMAGAAGAVLGLLGFVGVAAAHATAAPSSGVLTIAAVAIAAAVGAWAYAFRCRMLAAGDGSRRDEASAQADPSRIVVVPSGPVPAPGHVASLTPGDVFALERLVRGLYEALSSGPAARAWDGLRARFAPGALVEGWIGGSMALPAERFVALASMTARGVPVRETERTLHLFDDVAVAVSAFEELDPGAPGPSRGVVALQFRRTGEGWLIAGMTCRRVDRVFTLRRRFASGDPVPPPEPPHAA